MTVACGYGRPMPSNRFLMTNRNQNVFSGLEFAAALHIFGGDGITMGSASCGSCGACGACGACGSCGGELMSNCRDFTRECFEYENSTVLNLAPRVHSSSDSVLWSGPWCIACIT